MSYVAVDEDGCEYAYEERPLRSAITTMWVADEFYVELPKGSIKKLIGRDLTWEDEAVELKD